MPVSPPRCVSVVLAAVATAAASLLVAVPAAASPDDIAAFGISQPTVVTIRGTGDITTELAKAVGTAATADRPRLVELPTGQFKVKSVISVKNHVYLSAQPGTLVTWTGGSGQMLWFNSVTSGVSGGVWDGAKRSTANVFAVKAGVLKLENLTLRNAGKNGVAAYGGSKLTVRTVTATGNKKDGVYLEASVLDAVGLKAIKNRRNGLQLSGRSTGAISSSQLDGNGTAVTGSTTGKTGHGLGVASSQLSVSNSTMSSNRVCGVSLTGSAQVTISDSRLNSNRRHGLGTTAGSKATLVDTTVASNRYNGVLASGSGTRVDLNRVTITGSTKHGLSVPTRGTATITATSISGSGKVNASVSSKGRLTILAGNTISKARSHGIAVSSKGTLTISGEGNLVQSNRGNGLLVSKKGTAARISQPVRFVSNKKNAILVNSKAKLSMVACSYSGNGGKTLSAKSGGKITTIPVS